MRVTTRPARRVAVVLVGLALLVTSCGGSDEGVETSETTAASTTTTEVEGPAAELSGSGDPPKLLGNGDFETGDLTEWTDQSVAGGTFGGWFIYEDGKTPPTGDPRAYDYNVFDVSDPPQGRYAAVTDGNGGGLRVLYRDFEVDGPSVLHATVFYRTEFSPGYGFGETRILAPDVLSTGSEPNQQYRVDLIDPAAPIYSSTDGDVLATVFRTVEGDPVSLEPTEVTFDLSPWDGQTVRLRFAERDNRGRFFAGVDNVWIEPSN